ncbi:MAG: hypothetical protein HY673_16740 [Chloroflexi bacterium]|nr:hypothetical protein [Chloroflexota bacterium]
MDATAILERLTELGISVTPSGDKLVLTPASKLPPSLLEEIRANKPELLSYLDRRRHGQEVARRVDEEGCCLFWSETFGEPVAFIKDESFRASVPVGIVVYTKEEIETLWAAEGPSDAQRRLIHQAKKIANARVIDFRKGGNNADTPFS